MFALLVSNAFAGPFTDATVTFPYTTTFQFDWASVPNTGPLPSTEFTLASPSAAATSGACIALALSGAGNACIQGAFATGNGGEGTWEARAFYKNCVALGAGFQECDIYQRLTVTYDVFPSNNAVYVGTADAIRVIRLTPFFIVSLEETYMDDFSGTLSGPDTGTWLEL